jgi:mono/diheme cytochrome c family protein
MWIGFWATTLISITLIAIILREPDRQVQARLQFRLAAIQEAMDLYAWHCAECHGGAGEGLSTYPPLDSDYVRSMDESLLFYTIELGRHGTEMAAFGLNAGGVLTRVQIQNLVTLLRYGSWTDTARRIAELGLTPTEKPAAESAPADTPVLAVVSGAATPLIPTDLSPEASAALIAQGYEAFLNQCQSCHGIYGEGTELAPQLTSRRIQRTNPATLLDIITRGIPNTEMEGYGSRLTQDEKIALVYLFQHWDALPRP